MSYPYWPNGSVVGYQQLAYNSTTQVLTLAPGGNSVTLNGGSSSGSIVNTQIVNASTINAFPISSGSIDLTANSVYPGLSTVGVYIESQGNTASGIQLSHLVNGDVSAYGRIITGGSVYPSTMNIELIDGGDNLLSAITMNDNGITVGNLEVTNLTLNNDLNLAAGAVVRTEQASGLNTQHEVRLFNGNDLDVANLMPMATIYNSGTIEFGAGSGIAHYGTMTPGSNYMTIPGTSYSGATNVVLAPYTTFTLYTGGSGSGGSTQYDNQGNRYFSTFTAQPYLNGNIFNSYTMFMGN